MILLNTLGILLSIIWIGAILFGLLKARNKQDWLLLFIASFFISVFISISMGWILLMF